MQVFRHIPQALNPQAIAIGNFDGMHLGHQALLRQLTAFTQTYKITPAVMTFEPHPREFFTPQNAPARLASMREKLEYFAEYGIQHVYVQRFNRAFAAQSPAAFMQRLRQQLNANVIMVGEDFCFGAKRAGNVQTLIEHGFNVIPLPQVQLAAERVSSTLVRDALAAGDLSKAHTLLGRTYSISGKVVHGAKLGRQLGFPTANVHMRHERPALTGVYAVKLNHLPAVANLGIRPTLEGVPKLKLEVHVFDFNGDLYDQHVHVQFFHKLRSEQKFAGLEALKAQIACDAEQAKRYFSHG
ncbi:bifunctional riboflavin kinase/FAD synthetase [Methylophilus medardicus]|uniref:Riboflavin biosynthesis protein n=1 Tax=Methylophilus medardicus TaxID=2588534 RepID=A0A5B8CQJ4_9PROT|nr:bifunctional riboflavin kinase/FAD synthetase [Methylophilus medardicus]QDC43534.1 bifunctional riboflavin kinase/FAD synthetase [Methylophilus medardicus]QDC48541.1 bifunctional riboflavin kinase/FAD synthetase [Methylophilus medardicus]QDC52246.1 bifunctional riboflavin kinase/FAD synthetase [Methylophilus medardicus]